jgi:hypothetical protein
MSSRRLALTAGAVALAAIATPVLAQGAVAAQFRWLTFAVFGVIIAVTMYVTYIAAKRVKNVADFYAAGGGVSGLQNGWAIAGDYLSAASFLGIAGLISLYGYDGFMYSVGWLVAYITVLLVIAEPCRNIGKYTLSDILAYRNNQKAARIVGDGGRRADAGLRAVRRHGGDDVGADHQGDPAGHRVDRAGDTGVDALRLQPARVPDGGDRRCRRAGAGRAAAR